MNGLSPVGVEFSFPIPNLCKLISHIHANIRRFCAFNHRDAPVIFLSTIDYEIVTRYRFTISFRCAKKKILFNLEFLYTCSE